jgi:hypothetical protein
MTLPPAWFPRAVHSALQKLGEAASSAPYALVWMWEGPPHPEKPKTGFRAAVWSNPPEELPPLPPEGWGVLFCCMRLTPDQTSILSGLFQSPLPAHREVGGSFTWDVAVCWQGGCSGYWLCLGEGYYLRVQDSLRLGLNWGAVFWSET